MKSKPKSKSTSKIKPFEDPIIIINKPPQNIRTTKASSNAKKKLK